VFFFVMQRASMPMLIASAAAIWTGQPKHSHEGALLPDKSLRHSSSSAPNGASEAHEQCTFVAHLHVRKCGGTTVRNLMERLGDGWVQQGGYCSSMAEHAALAVPGGKQWIEVHCHEDLVAFNEGVAQLREKVEPAGCTVVTSLLLRDPVEQVASEWQYFYDGHLDRGSEGHPARWMTADEALERFALEHPEELLWTITTGTVRHRVWDDPPGVSEPHSLENNLAELHNLASCNSTLALLEPELRKVDVVGVMDTPEQFASWWLQLGKVAGFPAAAAAMNHTQSLAHGRRQRGLDDLSPAVRAQLEESNSCSRRLADLAHRQSSRWVDLAPHLEQDHVGDGSVAHTVAATRTTANAPAAHAAAARVRHETVQRLIAGWGGRDVVAESLRSGS
jgi:hypothetical protein